MSEAYPVEKNILIPPARRNSKYPFATMKPGESFWAPGAGAKHSAVAWKRKNAGWNYAARDEVKDGVNGVRIWRVVA